MYGSFFQSVQGQGYIRPHAKGSPRFGTIHNQKRHQLWSPPGRLHQPTYLYKTSPSRATISWWRDHCYTIRYHCSVSSFCRPSSQLSSPADSAPGRIPAIQRAVKGCLFNGCHRTCSALTRQGTAEPQVLFCCSYSSWMALWFHIGRRERRGRGDGSAVCSIWSHHFGQRQEKE